MGKKFIFNFRSRSITQLAKRFALYCEHLTRIQKTVHGEICKTKIIIMISYPFHVSLQNDSADCVLTMICHNVAVFRSDGLQDYFTINEFSCHFAWALLSKVEAKINKYISHWTILSR